MFRAALFSLVALSYIGTVLGASILDTYPELQNLTLHDTSAHKWEVTGDWKCPWYRHLHLETNVSVIKVGKCSYKPVTVPAGPALGCCNVQNNTDGPACSYRKTVGFTNTRPTLHGWKVRVSFDRISMPGEYRISEDDSGTITESAVDAANEQRGWHNLDPGFVYVPTVSYANVSCTGIVYRDTPWLWKTNGLRRSYIEGYDLDPPYWPDKRMKLSIPGSERCFLQEGAILYGNHDRAIANPGLFTIERDSVPKMANNYKDLWKEGAIELPLLGDYGRILAHYDMEKIPCSKAAELGMPQDGYIDLEASQNQPI